MTAHTSIRLRAAAALAGLSLLLTGCLISPGKFTSELMLLEDNQFSFTYEGEVFFLGLSQLAKQAQERDRGNREFKSYCYGPIDKAGSDNMNDDAVEAAVEAAAEAPVESVEVVDISEVAVETAGSNTGKRDCTAEEETEQRERWEERQESRAKRDREQIEQLSKIIGGIDPTDPEAQQELAKLLTRQKGFDRVEAKGDGLFDISYSISGSLDYDYVFPMIENFATTNPFVQLFLRDGDMVRVNAPGLAPQSVSNPVLPFMVMGPFLGSRGNREEEVLKDIPAVEGTFTIITTGDIRANNTDEGPVTQDGQQRLTWTINSRSTSTPTALIAMPR